ncbi:release factor glutamine methyltransferase [bacterium BMS3Bbin02]|nr:release factor glutamine methyltransferase [bacterium BMS3Bbin02]
MREFLASGVLPDHELVRLVTNVSGASRLDVLRGFELSQDQWRNLDDLVRRRLAGVPLQYLEGTVQFGPLELLCDNRALIPRPETEYLWERVVARLHDRPTDVIVDLCTGSGCLALALKHAIPEAVVYGADSDPGALSLARENVAYTALDVQLFEGDLFEALPGELRGQIDVLVINPPYLTEREFAALAVEVRDHDPRAALVAGETGLEMYSRIATTWIGWMRPGGLLALEIGETQGREVAEMFAAMSSEVLPDLSGRDRFLFGIAR